MIVSGNITQGGEGAPFSSAQLLDANRKPLPVGTSANDNGFYKIDTSRDANARFIIFKTAGQSKTIDISKIKCYTNSCNLDVELGGSSLDEVIVTPKEPIKIVPQRELDMARWSDYDRRRFASSDEDKRKKNMRNILLTSIPLILLASIAGYYIYKNRK